ncbi:hypothetical protein PAESOLCIP111_01147 [Paenibacillus solanacearum]|uniref:Uncharacterized protein n=1 Tax=Paenibacillus solanacearum TaxID=2048548 RepID=A0A916JZ20_9BACL|nr:hypothetical protein PAESOLCIP111_01147 [Paenibacillus solanacearum]
MLGATVNGSMSVADAFFVGNFVGSTIIVTICSVFLKQSTVHF